MIDRLRVETAGVAVVAEMVVVVVREHP